MMVTCIKQHLTLSWKKSLLIKKPVYCAEYINNIKIDGSNFNLLIVCNVVLY